MAYEFYIRVKGTKQGTFHGSSTSPHERQDRIPAYLVSHAVTQPRDQASGQASGKRVHQALHDHQGSRCDDAEVPPGSGRQRGLKFGGDRGGRRRFRDRGAV